MQSGPSVQRSPNPEYMPAVVRVTGEGRNVGKTTLAARLIIYLTDRGHRVSAIKRTHHLVPPDRDGSDTQLLAEAGASRVAFVGPDGVLERSAPTPLADVVVRLQQDADIVLVEGYRDESVGVQFHLEGPPPAKVHMRLGSAPFRETASANDLPLLTDFIERSLRLPHPPPGALQHPITTTA